jgi:putative membrane protein
MQTIQIIFISLVALIHIYIVYLEMVIWTSKKSMKAFGIQTQEFAEKTKVMAANQGLYNGFLVAGLIWSLIAVKTDIAIFFLICVVIAGIYGAYSLKNLRILYIQTIPASLGILSILLLS